VSVPGTRSAIVADNNEFYRKVLGDFFRDQGFDVRTARDGMQALEQLEQSPPDLLVLDLIMPSIDGAQLCSWVKSRQEHRHIPVIIVSGILSDEIDDLAAIGAEAYVAKMPMEQIATALKEAIRLLLSGPRGGAPILFGFEKMYRREVVLELIQDRRARAETLDSLSEGIVELSRERRILRTNRAFEAIAGRSSSEVLSRPLEEIFPDAGDAFSGLFAAASAEANTVAVFPHRGRHVQAKLHRVDHPTRTQTGELLDNVARQNAKVLLHSMLESIGFTLMVEDITDRVQTDRERETLKARLAQSEKMSALGVFVSGAAHELNNPLTSILGYSQLVMRKSAEHRADLQKIAEGAQRCKAIVEQLMAFARTLRPDRRATDLNALLRDVLAARKEGIAAEGIRVEERLTTEEAASLVDAAQIGQVFHHLFDNAIKALGQARGPRRLGIASRRQGDRIVIEVADSGPGIPEDRLDRVFDPFFTTSDVGTGRGLGLSVAYGIVTAHGGRIAAANGPEGGAVIRVELPASQEQPEREAVAAPQRPRADAAARRILVVDDEKVVAELIVEILADQNHQIDSAHNGIDALRLLRHRQYDLIILDLRMPDMSGQQMYQELERHHPEHVPRVLFVTGDTVMPEIQDFLRTAGNPCLLKPFSVDEVIRKANEILYAGARAQGASHPA
jgi:signal transduction histidine kinase/CheY-like chemotaxis protein